MLVQTSMHGIDISYYSLNFKYYSTLDMHIFFINVFQTLRVWYITLLT